jgi:hypothetical protein
MKNKLFTMTIVSGCVVMGGFIKGHAIPIMIGDNIIEVNNADTAQALYNAIQEHLLTTKNASETAQLYASAYIQCLNQIGAATVLEWNLPGMGGAIEDSIRYGLRMDRARNNWNYLGRSINSALTSILRGVLPILQVRRAAEAAHD